MCNTIIMSKRRERFEKIATKRVDSILKTLDLLANCSNKYNYEYNQNDVDKIFKAINRRVKITHSSFNQSMDKSKFEL